MKIAFTFDVEFTMKSMNVTCKPNEKNKIRDEIIREAIKKENQDELIEKFKEFTGFENVKLDIEIEGEL